jgi:DNA-binding NtrC family response regulator
MSASPPSCGPQKILLIDDDELIADSLRQYLSVQGCDVAVAVDSASARAMMAERGYDIVMVDPYLTGGVHKDGCDLIKSILVQQPGANVIVLTGYSSPELAESAADGKVAALLSKPQSVPFLSQFLVGMPPESIEPSIKGQTL